MKQLVKSAQELQKEVFNEINASALPKIKSGNHPIILLRNSKTAVKRAKTEFKEQFKPSWKRHNESNYLAERTGMIHQIVNSNPRFNLVLLVN